LPLALLLVPVVLVALGVGLIFVLGGGEVGGIIGGGDDDPVVPEFEFRVGKIEVEPTTEGTDRGALLGQATLVVPDVVEVLDALYTNAFLDPANWQEGDYEEILPLFSDAAQEPARGALDILTLGADAGEVYESVTPRKGGLTFKVLFDPEGVPHTIGVRIRFFGIAERQDGEFISILSAGQMFLQDLDGWTITKFDMRRTDKVAPPPTPAPSGSVAGSGGTGATTGATGATTGSTGATGSS
jgi:hypothetical protein